MKYDFFVRFGFNILLQYAEFKDDGSQMQVFLKAVITFPTFYALLFWKGYKVELCCVKVATSQKEIQPLENVRLISSSSLTGSRK